MLRTTAALYLLLACGVAAAQQAGATTVSSGPGNSGFVTVGDFNSVDFANIFAESSNRVYIIADFRDLIGRATGPTDPIRPPLRLESTGLLGDQVSIGIEGDGVRLPDEQFSLP